MSNVLLSGVVAAGLLLMAGAVRAQDRDDPTRTVIVTGTVLERGTESPVVAAAVRLIPQSGSARGAETDSTGSFSIAGVEPARYTVRVQRLGYRVLDYAVTLARGSELNLRIQLVPEALGLEPIVVEATRRSRLTMGGFEDRRRAGMGTYFTRDEIEEWPGSRISDFLRRVPGVRLLPVPGRMGYDVVMREGCRPLLVLDGMRLQDLPGHNFDEMLSSNDIEAIEVYRGIFVPVEFGSSNCGAVVVWTRSVMSQSGPTPWWKQIIIGAVLGAGVFLAFK